jgi:hypothetical protein
MSGRGGRRHQDERDRDDDRRQRAGSDGTGAPPTRGAPPRRAKDARERFDHRNGL